MTALAQKADPGMGDPKAPVGTEPWAQHVRLKMVALIHELPKTPERFAGWWDDIQRTVDDPSASGTKTQGWRLLNKPDGSHFKTFDDYCKHRQPWGLGKPRKEIEAFLVGLGRNPVVVKATLTAPAPSHSEAVKAQPRGAKGRVKGESTDSAHITNGESASNSRGSTSADYLTARIARDAPAVLERMKAGEFKSVRAAAKAAGIVKVHPPRSVAFGIVKKLGSDDRRSFFTDIITAYPREIGWAR